MITGRPKSELVLSAEETAKLTMMARRPKSDQRPAFRAAVVLDCGSGLSNAAVAAKHEVAVQTVGKWRERFVAQRLGGLGDAPRHGQPRKITDQQIEAVVTRTLEKKPVGATHWSTRSMAKASGLNQNAIVRIWRAFGLKPHLQETRGRVHRAAECAPGWRRMFHTSRSLLTHAQDDRLRIRRCRIFLPEAEMAQIRLGLPRKTSR